MKNKLLVKLIGLSLVFALVGILNEFLLEFKSTIMIEYGFTFYIFLGTYLLVKNGEFKKTRESKLVRLSISIVIAGILLKIMHWPLAGPVLLLGFVSILLFYLIYIIRVGKRKLITWLKFLFLTTFLMGRCFKIMHWPYGEELTILSILILSALIWDFIMYKNISMPNKNIN